MGQFVEFSEDALSIIKNKLYFRLQHHPSLEMNFISSNNGLMAAFIEISETYHSLFAITDDYLNSLFFYETNAYIGHCTISYDGCYAAFQTACSEFEDSNQLFFFDVKKKTLLWKVAPLEVKYLDSMYIDPDKQNIFLKYPNLTLKYDFNGNEITDTRKAKEKAVYHNINTLDYVDAFGISRQEFNELVANARKEVYADDKWEKELDAKNKARAGIEGPTAGRRKF